MKQGIISLVIVMITILIIFLGVNQYLEKQRYERYLSEHVANDIVRVSMAILNNQQTYNDILELGTISLQQGEFLTDNNRSIVKITQEYQSFAGMLKRINLDEVGNDTANNASDIAYFFQDLMWQIAAKEGLFDTSNRPDYPFPYELAKMDDVELGPIEIEKIKEIKQLNEAWFQTVHENVQGFSVDGMFNTDIYSNAYKDSGRDLAIKSSYWVDLIVDMDIKTKEYLTEENIDNIASILD